MKGIVQEGSTHLRSGTSSSCLSIAIIPQGTILDLTQVDSYSWFKTYYNGSAGYVMACYISVVEPWEKCAVVYGPDCADVRKKPSIDARILFSAYPNLELCLIDSTSVPGWYRVSTEIGTGWVQSSNLIAPDISAF